TRASLLARLRAGAADPGAWPEFVQLCGPLLLAWCRRWGLQHADADDVTQAVLLKLAGRLRDFAYDPARSFRGYLRVVAKAAWAGLRGPGPRAVPGGVGGDAEDALASAPARDDLAAQREADDDREVLELASARVRARVKPQTWSAFRLTALEGRSGAEAA